MTVLMVFLFAAVSSHVVFGANILTLPIPSSCPRTTAGLGSEPHFECTASIDWVGDQFDRENCRGAIQRLYNVEVAEHGNTNYEFLLPGAIPYTSNPVMQTPRRYNVGQSYFDPKELCVSADDYGQANVPSPSSCWDSSLLAPCLARIPSVNMSIQTRTLLLSKTSGWLPTLSRHVVSNRSICLAGRLLVRLFLLFSGTYHS